MKPNGMFCTGTGTCTIPGRTVRMGDVEAGELGRREVETQARGRSLLSPACALLRSFFPVARRYLERLRYG